MPLSANGHSSRLNKLLSRICPEPHVYLFCFAKSFAPENTVANSDKNFRGVSCWNPGGLCSGQSLHGPLDRQSNRYIISNLTVRHGKPPFLIGKSSTNGPWLPQHRAADGQQRRQHVQNGPTPQEEDCAEPSLAVTSSKTT